MSIFQKSSVANFTRGGQTTIHFIRMIVQVIKTFVGVAVASLVFLFGICFYYQTEEHDRYIATRYAYAYTVVNVMRQRSGTIEFRLEDGRVVDASTQRIIRNPSVLSSIERTKKAGYTSLMLSLLGTLLLVLVTSRFIFRFGTDQANDEHVRGGSLASKYELARQIRRRGAIKGVTIAGVPMPKGADVAHTLLCGSPGGGKSTIIKELLCGVRRNKQRAIVYDSSGEYVSIFYRPGIDKILNPFDDRSKGWDVWCECEKDYEYQRLAESLLPERGVGDPFWVLGARIVFVAIAKKVSQEKTPSNELMMHAIMSVSVRDIIVYLQNSEAAAIISEGGEKMAVSIRATLAAYANSLKYLPKDVEKMSIKNWIERDEGDSWLFLTTTNEQKTATLPLISAWMDTAIASVSSLVPDRKRRIWFQIDEVATLNKLPSLEEGLAVLRKFGGCFVLGIQSHSQLEQIYRREGAETIVGTCSTWCVFRSNSKVAAKFVSENLGDSETVETSEGISFGANEIRDGVNLSKQRNVRPVVMPTQIMNLEDLNCYIKFGRNFPIAKIRLKYKNYKQIATGFIPRILDEKYDIYSSKTTEMNVRNDICDENGSAANESLIPDASPPKNGRSQNSLKEQQLVLTGLDHPESQSKKDHDNNDIYDNETL